MVTNGRGAWNFTGNYASINWGGLPFDEDIALVQLGGTSGSPTTYTASGTGGTASISAGGYSFSISILSDTWYILLCVFPSAESGGSSIPVLFLETNNAIELLGSASGWQSISGTGLFATVVFTLSGAQIGAPGVNATLPQIVSNVCTRTGLTSAQVDTSLLTDGNIYGGSTTVLGYLVERPAAAAEILKPLMQGYFFDGCETNGTMKWVPRGLSSALTIPESDLGLLSDGAKVKPEQIAQEQDLPLAFTVLYNDIALDYQQGSQQRTRSSRVKKTKQQTIISLPIVMTATQALQIAETALYLAWLERNSYTFNLGSPKYMQLDPTDVIEFVYEGLTFQIRIVENSLGQGFAVMISGVNEDARNFLSSLSAPAPVGFNPAPIRLVVPSQLFLFDLALLQDTDANPGGTGFYFVMGSSMAGWTAGVLLDSSDNSNFAQESATSLNATFGYATTTLAAPREPWELDTVNTVTVRPVNGAPAGVSMLDMLNGANALIFGNGEIVQALDVADNMDGTYTFSNLLRGRRGTEWACGTHGANELFVMPSTGAQRVQDPLSVLGPDALLQRRHRGPGSSTVTSQSFAISGADLKPYAPAGIGGTVDGSGNITITWIRRTRIGGEADWADGVADVPLSEDSEAYSVDMLNGSAVVRTDQRALPRPPATIPPRSRQPTFGSVQAIGDGERLSDIGAGGPRL